VADNLTRRSYDSVMPYSIRPAQPGELGAVLELWRGGAAEPTHTDDAEGLRTLLQRDANALLVALDDNVIVGSIIAAWDGWRGSIYRLVVAPTERRRGLGRQLLEAAERRLTAAGARRMQAVVVATDDRASAFWSASGWNRQVERLRFVRG
jgi:ribosomal protein S18 acetylase RimI-like enzyme